MQNNNVKEIRLEAVVEEMERRVENVRADFQLLNDLMNEPAINLETTSQYCSVIKTYFKDFDSLENSRKELIAKNKTERPSQGDSLKHEMSILKTEFVDREREINLYLQFRDLSRDILTLSTNTSMNGLIIKDIIRAECVDISQLVGVKNEFLKSSTEMDKLMVKWQKILKGMEKNYPEHAKKIINEYGKEVQKRYSDKNKQKIHMENNLKKYNNKIKAFEKQQSSIKPVSNVNGKDKKQNFASNKDEILLSIESVETEGLESDDVTIQSPLLPNENKVSQKETEADPSSIMKTGVKGARDDLDLLKRNTNFWVSHKRSRSFSEFETPETANDAWQRLLNTIST